MRRFCSKSNTPFPSNSISVATPPTAPLSCPAMPMLAIGCCTSDSVHFTSLLATASSPSSRPTESASSFHESPSFTESAGRMASTTRLFAGTSIRSSSSRVSGPLGEEITIASFAELTRMSRRSARKARNVGVVLRSRFWPQRRGSSGLSGDFGAGTFVEPHFVVLEGAGDPHWKLERLAIRSDFHFAFHAERDGHSRQISLLALSLQL